MYKLILDILFFVFTFLSFTTTTYNPPWTSLSMEFFAFLAAFALILSALPKLFFLQKNNVIIFLSLFSFFSLLSYFLHPSSSIEKLSLALLFSMTGILFSSIVFVRKNEILDKYLISIIFAGMFSIFIIMTQKFDIWDSLGIWKAGYDESHGRPYANFGQPNLAATFILLSFCCAIFLEKKISKYIIVFLAILYGAALALASSKTSFLSIFLLILISIFFKRKIDFLFFMILSLSVGFFKFLFITRTVDGSDISTGRFEIWYTIVDSISRSPLSGYGVLNTRVAQFEVSENHPISKLLIIGNSHNLLLDIIVWFGIPLGSLLIFFIFKLASEIIANNKKTPSHIYLIVPLMTHSLLEYPLAYANFFFAFLFLLSISIKENVLRKSNRISFSIFSFIFIIVFVIFSAIGFDYKKLSDKFTNLRYYNANFIFAKKPEKINFMLLNDTVSQYNFFISSEINSIDDFLILRQLVKQEPTLKNFCLLIDFLSKNAISKDNNFLWEKAKANLNDKDFSYLIYCDKSKK